MDAKALNRMAGLARRCMADYAMIDGGETVAVCVSGGKDSLVLLYVLAELRRYYPQPFSLHALTLDMGLCSDYSPVEELCRSLDIPYTVKKTEIGRIIFDERQESNPCALCSKMRRGALCDAAKALGISKIALGHNYDDAIETFMMSLVFEGRISCFEPVTHLSRSGITQIRPLLYAGEGMIRNFAERAGLPIIKNPCPMDGNSKRQEVKELISSLSVKYPDLKSRIFGSVQRYPLNGWELRR